MNSPVQLAPNRLASDSEGAVVTRSVWLQVSPPVGGDRVRVVQEHVVRVLAIDETDAQEIVGCIDPLEELIGLRGLLVDRDGPGPGSPFVLGPRVHDVRRATLPV